ncbi:hypothetical protein L211DRAFT_852782 [Terfezia boudieri ATCC MYA-4762]|uniref:Uncharacterized protein n=1 Tax=Terfezia boudieri ATCC MYA-4762 TaxID=1051890 RepID=A0A3N4LAG9_9PEZI|nr:hypothetical protein L211DRAFT_852782 [Terfezia boudieri ATCC MYA-4762]
MSTEITNIARELELALEVAKLTQKQAEQISFVAQVQKEVIEGWTDKDYAEMQVDRATADAALGFTSTILLLADIHTESERKARGKKAVAEPQPESQILEGSAGQILQAESQILERSAVLETQRSIPDESSAPTSKEVEAEACAEPRLSIEAVMDTGKGREVDSSEPKYAEATPNPCKRKSAPNEVQKRWKYGVQIPVINLDVEEGVEELKREALGEEDKDEALAVENAVKMLFRGEGRPHKETARRLLEKVMHVMKVEIVEVEED